MAIQSVFIILNRKTVEEKNKLSPEELEKFTKKMDELNEEFRRHIDKIQAEGLHSMKEEGLYEFSEDDLRSIIMYSYTEILQIIEDRLYSDFSINDLVEKRKWLPRRSKKIEWREYKEQDEDK